MAPASPAEESTSRGSIGARRNPETEAAVLDAAEALIAEEGFAKLTMEAVARRARAGKATLYRWWPSRAHLLLALYSRAKNTLTQPETGSFSGDLTEYLTSMVRQWQGGRAGMGQIFRLLIAEAQMDPAVSEAVMRERQERWHHIDTIVAKAQARGDATLSVSHVRIEHRIISMMWYLLLTDQLPAEAEVPGLVRDLLADLGGTLSP